MITKNKNSNEATLHESTIESMKNNIFLDINDIVNVVETNSFYQITEEITDIPCQNNLYAKKIESELSGTIDKSKQLYEERTISISGAATGSCQFDGSKDVDMNIILNGIDASKITSGVIDINRIPVWSIPRPAYIVVNSDEERFSLQQGNGEGMAKNGDTIQVLETNKMYLVIDDTNLDNEEGYQIYSAGIASEVPWTGVTGKPSTYPPSTHTQSTLTINSLDGYYNSIPYSALNSKDTLNSALSKIESGINSKASIDGEYEDLIAGKAISLKNYVTINNTNFNGTSNILTDIWGKSRLFTIGNQSKSINGSNNVEWDLDTIGAASINHTHEKLETLYSKNKNFISSSSTESFLLLGKLNASIGTGKNGTSFIISGGSNYGNPNISQILVTFSSRNYSGTGPIPSNLINAIELNSNQIDNGIYFVIKLNNDKLELWLALPPYPYNINIQNINDIDFEWSDTFVGTSTNPSNGTFLKVYANKNWNSSNFNPENKANISGTYLDLIVGSSNKLSIPRTINGTSYDGTSDITTVNWGTSRNITIGKTTKSYNGSNNVSWSLSEIGALPSSGGNMTGNLVGSSNYTISGFGKVYNAVWNDYAEFFERGENTEPGDIIALDFNCSTEKYVKATLKNNCIVGVHSDSFAHLIGGEEAPEGIDFYEYNIKKFIPVGLSGRVMCKVIGKVKKGEAIYLSEYPGIGIGKNSIKFENSRIIGYSIEDKFSEEISKIKIIIR